MSRTDLETVGHLLQEITFEPKETTRLEDAVTAINGQVLAAARERLAFEDEPAAYVHAVARTRAP